MSRLHGVVLNRWWLRLPLFTGRPLGTIAICRRMVASTDSCKAEEMLPISALKSDLDLLQKRWMRSFRVCISSDANVVVETSTDGKGLWLPLTTLEVDAVPQGLVSAVNASLDSAPSMELGQTVVDLRDRGEDLAAARKALAAQFPRLRLSVDHSKGTDLQGNVTHSVSLSLQAHDPTNDLTAEEERVKETFFGEAIGVSYMGTVRRAICEAFDAARLDQPQRQPECDPGCSEMGVYMGIASEAAGEKLLVVTTPEGEDNVQVVVKTHGGRQMGMLHGCRKNALSVALACVEKVAEEVNASATEAARKRIMNHPVVLALPSKGIRPKEILRRLLHHTYGLTEERILLATSQGVGCTFVTAVKVELCWKNGAVDQETSGSSSAAPLVVTLAKAAGVNKRATESLACMEAIKDCFPRIFEDQLSFHTEVREIMQSSKATVSASICPHISKGILEQLRWAARSQMDKEVLIETAQLLPNSENEALGIRTTRPMWAAQLFLVDKNDNREFVVLALDNKKSASEQKAIAAALYKCFREHCKDGVQYAMKHGLIDGKGDVTPCEGVSPCGGPLPHNEAERAAECDPFIPHLQLVSSQRIPVPQRHSIIGVYRRGIQLYVNTLNETDTTGSSAWRLVEHIERTPTVHGSFKAQLFLKRAEGATGDGATIGAGEEECGVSPTMTPLGEPYYSTTAVSALHGAMKCAFEKDSAIVKAQVDNAQVRDICTDTQERLSRLEQLPPQLPASTPLEAIAQCIMTKYGLTTELRICGEGKLVNVQIFGRGPSPVESGEGDNTPQFFIAHGRGSSILKAVVSCCQRAFATHFEDTKEDMESLTERAVKTKSIQVPITRKGSFLASRIDCVKKEVTENSDDPDAVLVYVTVDVDSSQSEKKYEAVLSVADGSRVVELERTSSFTDLIAALLQLVENVNRELGRPSSDLEAVLHRCSGPRQCGALQDLVVSLFGFPVEVNTVLRDRQWYCHISVQISEELSYGIGYAVDGRKKEAVENASAAAMHRCFHAACENLRTCLPSSVTPGAEQYCGFVYHKPGVSSVVV
ncbi:hypothetical protein TRVL_01022 [Trypanosoma vivax]|uniref:Uncharacterized protein n=1 Tax=Trypanosoma vivax (strain Y486) TaxID=1055687 RepID=G0U9P6_TRYVY|nr:hypothetical protein TRVL_01022 [Trypanosoma vivax]CCC52526.1 conserved hypothetical protein [Trypanosoma vivax Y486]